jgi:hypothetical protein
LLPVDPLEDTRETLDFNLADMLYMMNFDTLIVTA